MPADPPPAPVRLAIEAQHTRLAAGVADAPAVGIAVGWQTLAQRFRHAVPTPVEIEHAIEVVEDAIDQVVARPGRSAALVAADPALEALVRAANPVAGDDATASIEAVENLFTRLAAGASGSLAASDALPEDRRFAATLVILRELMHHLRFGRITVSAGGTAEASRSRSAPA